MITFHIYIVLIQYRLRCWAFKVHNLDFSPSGELLLSISGGRGGMLCEEGHLPQEEEEEPVFVSVQ